MELIKKSFRDCTLTFMDKTFKMRQVETLEALENWLNTPNDVSDFEAKKLVHLCTLLDFNVHDWNEHELDTHCIGPIFSMVNFSSYEFNHFQQRDFGGVVENYELSGKPDSMVASGRREPEMPCFAFFQKKALIQKHKEEPNENDDPAGQALAAMLIAQQMEEDKKTMYGCYVIGSSWKFIALNTDRTYDISKDFSALDDEIFDILRILKNLKNIVIERTRHLQIY